MNPPRNPSENGSPIPSAIAYARVPQPLPPPLPPRGYLPTQRHQTTHSGASPVETVDNQPVPLIDTLIDVVEGFATPRRFTSERHPNIRSAEDRAPLPAPVRLAVLLRDAFRCAHCGFSVRREAAQLDHIKPWSAGGSDTTPNLRTMCTPCNQARSNFIDTDEAPRQPATFWCDGCVGDLIRLTGERLLFRPNDGHSCWFCRQDWWMCVYGPAAPRPAEGGHAVLAPPTAVPAYCLHCRVHTVTRWSL